MSAISVVIPVHNEMDNVQPLAREVHSVLDGIVAHEIIFVDDGSTDDTPSRLAETAATTPTVRMIRHMARAGQSEALRTGIVAARFPLVVTLDGDGQNVPGDIPGLLDAWRDPTDPPGPALVIGHRVDRHDSWIRRAASRVANTIRGRLLGDRTPDVGCGLKVFPRDAFLALPRFAHMHRFLPTLIMAQDGQVRSVPVRHRARRHGRSHYGIMDRLWAGMVDLIGVMWLVRRSRVPRLADRLPLPPRLRPKTPSRPTDAGTARHVRYPSAAEHYLHRH